MRFGILLVQMFFIFVVLHKANRIVFSLSLRTFDFLVIFCSVMKISFCFGWATQICVQHGMRQTRSGGDMWFATVLVYDYASYH